MANDGWDATQRIYPLGDGEGLALCSTTFAGLKTYSIRYCRLDGERIIPTKPAMIFSECKAIAVIQAIERCLISGDIEELPKELERIGVTFERN